MIKCNFYTEWVDNIKPIKRTEDVTFVIELYSDENPSLVGSTFSVTLFHYATGSRVDKVLSSWTQEVIEAEYIKASSPLKHTDTFISSLPSIPVTMMYEVRVTFPNTDVRLIKEGRFVVI